MNSKARTGKYRTLSLTVRPFALAVRVLCCPFSCSPRCPAPCEILLWLIVDLLCDLCSAQKKEEREKQLRGRFENLKIERQKKWAGINLYIKVHFCLVLVFSCFDNTYILTFVSVPKNRRCDIYG